MARARWTDIRPIVDRPCYGLCANRMALPQNSPFNSKSLARVVSWDREAITRKRYHMNSGSFSSPL